MDSSINIYQFGSLLVESEREESDEAVVAEITDILCQIYGHIPNWLKFKFGRRFERKGKIYREFLCPAGSVDSQIQMHAQKPGGISRGIIFRGSCAGLPSCREIRLGIETEFDCKELTEVIL